MSLRILSRFQKAKDMNHSQYITIVSGLPRSGTSMMMKMLEAGGLEIVTDEQRTADESNPKGYYEFEQVKKLKDGDQAWVDTAQGKAVKVISALLEYLPPTYEYKIIFMRRKMEEILASQLEMLRRRGEPTGKIDDSQMAELFQKHLVKVEAWLDQQPNIEVIYTSYNDMLANTKSNLECINQFLENRLDTERMQQVVDNSLYRQRGS